MSELNIMMVCGQCPVEGEGTLNGEPFYFRARGKHWTFSVGADPVGDPRAEYREKYSDERFAAGWMSDAEARAFIERAAKMMTPTNAVSNHEDAGCPLCGYDCAGANPPMVDCPMMARK